ncbi:RNA polymerase, 7 kDa subunit [Dictyostelium discoideum AX4]|uniref:DNA-directed RNA polymerases I, II, and III subunit rpabc4 n=2 Tax=Dictyostelium TaxID=5782 RepID=RPAB4_DICDI|nr:RNA polymerase, 7 kDa subunit [Dictyostelium discoideum AX4]Q54R66.1 RecName: Full=DNA-directed RNA polymerases I, II, and III subunit rpabc4; Short=RNA polymerases I, II, and III subunit ABC4; AltName: Full=DNA-directed RNA polymerase II subunit K [Dictyostelium discoideum]EAL65759.1 RNA polymerase, 7 kDa subunit [Dictyostelium discoideum AX4]|eukprot:XP_639117.1 RNA polymerase, 7 kDa subunit [Dictyostelium discoideum AX4]
MPCLYICGECGAEHEIKPKEPVKCKDCTHRIMYKKRTDKMIQFEAR